MTIFTFFMRKVHVLFFFFFFLQNENQVKALHTHKFRPELNIIILLLTGIAELSKIVPYLSSLVGAVPVHVPYEFLVLHAFAMVIFLHGLQL